MSQQGHLRHNTGCTPIRRQHTCCATEYECHKYAHNVGSSPGALGFGVCGRGYAKSARTCSSKKCRKAAMSALFPSRPCSDVSTSSTFGRIRTCPACRTSRTAQMVLTCQRRSTRRTQGVSANAVDVCATHNQEGGVGVRWGGVGQRARFAFGLSVHSRPVHAL